MAQVTKVFSNVVLVTQDAAHTRDVAQTQDAAHDVKVDTPDVTKAASQVAKVITVVETLGATKAAAVVGGGVAAVKTLAPEVANA